MRVFSAALRRQMNNHDDTAASLLGAIEPGSVRRYNALKQWRRGNALPRFHSSFKFLKKIEKRYRLPNGYLQQLARAKESDTDKFIKSVRIGDQRIARFHLPESFERKSPAQQAEITDWIRRNVLACNTEYGRYLQKMSPTKYAVRFPKLKLARSHRKCNGFVGLDGSYGNVDAPQRLSDEMRALIRFKTAILPPPNMARYAPWSEASVSAAIRKYGQLFGALAAAPKSKAMGRGVPLGRLGFGILVFPAVWDWYLMWRQRRKGFFSFGEQDLLFDIKAMSRDRTGWLRQSPSLAKHMKPLPGLVSASEINWARRHWQKANDRLLRYARDRIPEMLRTRRAHKDPFAPILPVLLADSPLAEYRKICDEILRQLALKNQTPISAAHAIRSYLMVRLALHLGVRQRNLRELLLCKPGEKSRSERELQHLRRGEIGWNKSNRAWEVLIPAVAFKNGRSSYFMDKPFKLTLPDLQRLYYWIGIYIAHCRPIMLAGADDPGTFFVKSPRATSTSGELDLFSFYEIWKFTIQRYGIYNPHTRRGAIKGLLPHGPHCVRDVLATHVLKQTESYDIAGFAIQDTAESVRKHYARFLPEEKAARAARVLNQAWEG